MKVELWTPGPVTGSAKVDDTCEYMIRKSRQYGSNKKLNQESAMLVQEEITGAMIENKSISGQSAASERFYWNIPSSSHSSALPNSLASACWRE